MEKFHTILEKDEELFCRWILTILSVEVDSKQFEQWRRFDVLTLASCRSLICASEMVGGGIPSLVLPEP